MSNDQKPDLRRAGNIPKETLDYLAEKKGGKNTASGVVILLSMVVALAFVVSWIFSDNKKQPGNSASIAIASSPSISPSKSQLTNCNVVDAEQVLSSATRMASVRESASGATYEFSSEWWPVIEPKKTALMEGIANADACKYKEARVIIFHSPSGLEVGRADPTSGFHF